MRAIKNLLVTFSLAALWSVTSAQTFTWDSIVGTSIGNVDWTNDLGVSSSGDAYIVFKQNDGVNNDAMFAKFSGTGVVQYLKRYERTFMDTLASQNEEYISVLPSGSNVYAMGHQYNGAFTEIILHKYSAAGSIVWSAAYNDGAGCTPVKNLVEDGSGNLYVLFNRTGSSNNVRIAKFNSLGAHQWTKSFAYSGKTASSFHFDAASGSLIANITGAAGSTISKFNLSGTRLWSSNFSELYTREILVDSSSNLYTLGRTSSNNAIVARKFNSGGTQQWSHTTPVVTGYMEATDLCIDASGNLYAVGFFQFNLAFTSVLFSLDSSGTSRFYQQDSSLPLQAYYNIGLGAGGYLYVSGYFNTVSSANIRAKIDKIDTSGTFFERREATVPAMTLSYGWTMAFDTLGNAFIAGAHKPTTEEKVYIAKF